MSTIRYIAEDTTSEPKTVRVTIQHHRPEPYTVRVRYLPGVIRVPVTVTELKRRAPVHDQNRARKSKS
jgi:hypothetical protein